jgi:hypothetical protein
MLVVGCPVGQVLAELAAWGEARSGGGGGSGNATAGRQLTAGPLRLDPPHEVRALMAAIDEVHYLDVGLNCRGAYNLGAWSRDAHGKCLPNMAGFGLYTENPQECRGITASWRRARHRLSHVACAEHGRVWFVVWCGL